MEKGTAIKTRTETLFKGSNSEWVYTLVARGRLAATSLLLTSVFLCSLQSAYGQVLKDLENRPLGKQISDSIRRVYQDSDSHFWLGCSGGLFRTEKVKFINVASPSQLPNTNHEPAQANSPLKLFGRLVSDRWTVTARTGKKMYHTWKWGPGKYSIERWTESENAQGDPWRELIVYYWHPQEKRVRFLGISPYASGINQGTINFDGDVATADSKLAQTQGLRTMQTRWRFIDEDRYQETLLEKDAKGNLFELVSFEHLRVTNNANPQPEAESSSAISDEFAGLKFLIGNDWKSRVEGKEDGSTRSSITWIPHAKFLYGRVFRESEKREADTWSNFYVYHDVETKRLRCLILTNGATLYEGEVRIMREGNVQLDLKSHSSDAVASVSTSIEARAQGRLRQEIRTVNDLREPVIMNIAHQR